ncbi:MAG: aspartate aminotransferase family protein [Clostridiales bacterium]|nr:aspartate aminotransferase family protein [Clostridiales bacterium]
MADKNKLLSYYDDFVMKNYAPYPIVIDHGDGSYLYDTEGREYLDFLDGIAVNSLGYNNKEIFRATVKQAKKIFSCSNYFLNEPAILLARELVRGTHFDKAFLCNSGTEANEAALKIVKKYNNDKKSGLYKFVSFENSFHGRTLGALAATGQDKYKAAFAPLPDWFDFVPFGDGDALEKALKAPHVAGLIMECIQGEGGVITPSKEFCARVQSLVKKHKKLLIIDEVQTGAGRTGSFFVYSEFGLKPDILTAAKGLAGGLPIGAVLVTEELSTVLKAGDHGSTFGGNPMSAAVAGAAVRILKNKKFLDEVAEKGAYLKKELTHLHEKYPFVKEVRGKGLILGMELSENYPAKGFNQKFLDKGLILMAAGNNTIRFLPPLTVTIQEIDKMLSIVKDVFDGISK